jgi:hypothetical protein
MACGSCGGGGKIIADKAANPALRTIGNKPILRPQRVLVKNLRPFNNIDKRA